jgi:hypothetical protein
MKKYSILFLIPVFLIAGVSAVLANGRGGHRGLDPRNSSEFMRRIVEMEQRRAYQPGYYENYGSEEEAKSGSGTDFDRSRSDSAGAVKGSETPTATLDQLNGAEVQADGLPEKSVPNPSSAKKDSANKDGEKGFLAKTGSAVGGFFKKAGSFLWNNKMMLGGALAGGLVGFSVGGPFGAVLGALIGGFGGSWLGYYL